MMDGFQHRVHSFASAVADTLHTVVYEAPGTLGVIPSIDVGAVPKGLDSTQCGGHAVRDEMHMIFCCFAIQPMRAKHKHHAYEVCSKKTMRIFQFVLDCHGLLIRVSSQQHIFRLLFEPT